MSTKIYIPDEIFFEISRFYVAGWKEYGDLCLVSKRLMRIMEGYNILRWMVSRRWPFLEQNVDLRKQFIEQTRIDMKYDPGEYIDRYKQMKGKEPSTEEEKLERDLLKTSKLQHSHFQGPMNQYVSRPPENHWFRYHGFEVVFLRKRFWQYSVIHYELVLKHQKENKEKPYVIYDRISSQFRRRAIDLADEEKDPIHTISLNDELFYEREEEGEENENNHGSTSLLQQIPEIVRDPQKTFKFWKILHEKFLGFALDGLFDSSDSFLEKVVTFIELVLSKGSHKCTVVSKRRILRLFEKHSPENTELTQENIMNFITNISKSDGFIRIYDRIIYNKSSFRKVEEEEEEDNYEKWFRKNEKFDRMKTRNEVREERRKEEEKMKGGEDSKLGRYIHRLGVRRGRRGEKSTITISPLVFMTCKDEEEEKKVWNNNIGDHETNFYHPREKGEMKKEQVLYIGEIFIYEKLRWMGMIGDMEDTMYESRLVITDKRMYLQKNPFFKEERNGIALS